MAPGMFIKHMQYKLTEILIIHSFTGVCTLQNSHVSIQLENNTTDGIQTHKKKNNGHGFITGEEGHNFLSSITYRQSEGVAERAPLRKLWSGKGDSNILSSGTRGFEKTSMSICIFIQPQPFLSELMVLNGDDGLIGRFYRR